MTIYDTNLQKKPNFKTDTTTIIQLVKLLIKCVHYTVPPGLRDSGIASNSSHIKRHLQHNMVKSSHTSTNLFPRQCIFATNSTKSLHIAMHITTKNPCETLGGLINATATKPGLRRSRIERRGVQAAITQSCENKLL